MGKCICVLSFIAIREKEVDFLFFFFFQAEDGIRDRACDRRNGCRWRFWISRGHRSRGGGGCRFPSFCDGWRQSDSYVLFPDASDFAEESFHFGGSADGDADEAGTHVF